MEIRQLGPEDQPALEAFLRNHMAEGMILLGNMIRSGITDGPEPYMGRYAATVEGGRVTGVAAHYWNGMLLLCAPKFAAEVAATAAKGRRIAGILGPWQQALAAQDAFDLAGSDCLLRSKEVLMSLRLEALRFPEARPNQQLSWRLATRDDLSLLAAWREKFRLETMGDTESHALSQHCESEIARWIAEQNLFLLLDGDRPVSCCCFTVRLPDAVQLGNVWTPPEFRSRGYARMVVAHALRYAKQNGAGIAILFTPQENAAARTAYALGFNDIGDYAMLVYR